MMENELALARIVWDFMKLTHEPKVSDAILCLGGNDSNVARVAAGLWHSGWSTKIIMSGGIAHENDLAATGWKKPESEVFSDVAIECGVKKSAIFLESRAKNTGENFEFSREIINRDHTLQMARVLVVAKPYTTRRGFSTGSIVWPNTELCMQCEDVDMDRYLGRWPDPTRILNIIVGDLHRIIVYPSLGYQTDQNVPGVVIAAFHELVSLGYGRHLIPGFPIQAV